MQSGKCLIINDYLGFGFKFYFLSPVDRGTVQKVIVLPKDPVSMEELTLEEVEVFRVCFGSVTLK